MVVGWFSAALYWLVRRPGNRLGSILLAVAVCTVLMSLQGATQPQLHSIGVLADWLLVLLWFYVDLRVPEGSLSRVASDGRCSARSRSNDWSRTSPRSFSRRSSMAIFRMATCNAACPANGFMIADRPTIADGLFSSDVTTHYLFAVRVRNLRLLDLPASDGDAAAEAGTPACLRPGSDDHRSASWSSTAARRRARATWMRARSRSVSWLATIGYQRSCHTDFCFRSW